MPAWFTVLPFTDPLLSLLDGSHMSDGLLVGTRVFPTRVLTEISLNGAPESAQPIFDLRF